MPSEMEKIVKNEDENKRLKEKEIADKISEKYLKKFEEDLKEQGILAPEKPKFDKDSNLN